MKKLYKIFCGIFAATVLLSSCSYVLEEHPKTRYTPDFFTTPDGVEGGLTALYTHLRYLYGTLFQYNILTTGTDEATFAQSADANFKIADMSGNGVVTPSACNSSLYWNFTYINTANGIIENAAKVDLSPALIAEAKFFRAFEYFNMVQMFGGVPLDLGAGELAFNSSPERTSVRNTVAEVYEKCIFPDLQFCVENLPEVGRKTGTVTKTAARIVLSKAYLTYGWWLENPNDIPTYPECTRNAGEAKSYFQKAYDIAVQAIENPGPFGLEEYFYKIYLGGNDRNKEQVLYADRTENSEKYNGASYSYSSNGTYDNAASWLMQWNYPNMKAVANTGKKINPVLRIEDQFLGRPWIRMCPTQEALAMFDNKQKDSRYDGTFTTIYRANWPEGDVDAEWVEGPFKDHIYPKDPFVVFLDEDEDGITYPENVTGFNFGQKDGVPYYVVPPSAVGRLFYPGLWKLGPWRAAHTSGLGQYNAPSTRPFTILKFSELYFIAAEAAVKGASTVSGKSARELINVLRARAGKWEIKNNLGVEYKADFSAELCAETPQVITVDYILDERFREDYGDGHRWYELVRTQTWDKRAATYTVCSAAVKDHKPVTYTRTIEKYHYLRPIPQTQIDAMMMSDGDKAAYQNPGYPTE